MFELSVFYWANSTQTELFNFADGNYLVVHSTKNGSQISPRLSVSHFVSSYTPNGSFCTRLLVHLRASFTPTIPFLSLIFIRTPFKINIYNNLMKYYKVSTNLQSSLPSNVPSRHWINGSRHFETAYWSYHQGSKFQHPRKTQNLITELKNPKISFSLNNQRHYDNLIEISFPQINHININVPQ